MNFEQIFDEHCEKNNINGWARFRLVFRMHIEFLEKMEKEDPSFQCSCRVCQMTGYPEETH